VLQGFFYILLYRARISSGMLVLAVAGFHVTFNLMIDVIGCDDLHGF
jgi:hypothetical protein